MIFGDINLIILLFLVLLASVLVNTNTSLHLLLTAELLWITLFSTALLIGIIWDNLNLLSLTFFFLVLSAIEFGVGLILMLCQNTITRSININDSDTNFVKFFNRSKVNLFLNRTVFKI